MSDIRAPRLATPPWNESRVPNPVRPAADARRLARLGAVALLALNLIGCDDPSQNGQSSISRNELSAEQVESELLANVANSLNHLEEFINVELRPATIALDSRMSTDGEPIEAVCTRRPGDEEGPFNYITVVTKNADFRRNRIRSGDLLRYFVLQDLAFGDRDDASTAIVMTDYFEIPIAQVVGDNELIIVGQLPIAVETPAKLEVWRYNDDRSRDIRSATARYASEGIPPLGWEPSPDDLALEHIEQTLTQWTQSTARPEAFIPDPLLETLPEELRESRVLGQFISAETLGQLRYRRFEIRTLQEAIWLRDISNWARGSSLSELDSSQALFDWVIRNIQLEATNPDDLPRRLWEVLLYGRGTARERAWVFAELCRQQQLTVVMLGAIQPNGEVRFWLPALWSEGQFFLFEPELGFPVPAVGRDGVATLAEARGNDDVLRQLDLDDDNPYPWSKDDLSEVTAMVVSAPLALSRRVRLLESRLAGDEAVVLSVEPSAIARQLESSSDLSDRRLWDFPYRQLRARVLLQEPKNSRGTARLRQRTRIAREFLPFALTPKLWKGRVLHFQGKLETIVDENFAGLEDRIDSHQDARKLFTEVRLTNDQIARLPSEESQQIALKAKRDATYWIGMLNFDDERYTAVEEWLRGRILDADPDSEWRWGARYNLARVYEQLGRTDEAIALYEQDDSPQRHGNRLRGRRLKDAR